MVGKMTLVTDDQSRGEAGGVEAVAKPSSCTSMALAQIASYLLIKVIVELDEQMPYCYIRLTL